LSALHVGAFIVDGGGTLAQTAVHRLKLYPQIGADGFR
jgi:hypothetical protein